MLTREQILALPAGPALDAAVAEHVMGLPSPVGARTPEQRWRAIGSAATVGETYPVEGCDYPLTVDGVNYRCVWDRSGGADGPDGWVWRQREGKPWQAAVESLVAGWIDPDLKPYSTTGDGMLAVWNKMIELGEWPGLTYQSGIFDEHRKFGWFATFRRLNAWHAAEEAPHAVAVAALLALAARGSDEA